MLYMRILEMPVESDLPATEGEEVEIKTFFPRAKIYLISDGTYVEEMKAVKKENYIAALGRIHPVKGYDILIEAFAKIHNQYPE